MEQLSGKKGASPWFPRSIRQDSIQLPLVFGEKVASGGLVQPAQKKLFGSVQ